MDNIIEFNTASLHVGNIRFCAKHFPVLDYDNIYEATLIVLEEVNSGKVVEITGYNRFFVKNPMLNNEISTRWSYAKFITMFLNYIFFDREDIKRDVEKNTIKNLDKIENLTVDDGNKFLDDYKNGEVGSKYKKQRATIIKAEIKLTTFYYFLAGTYEMKNIKKSQFSFKTPKVIYSEGRNKEKKILKSLFSIIYPEIGERPRLENLSLFALSEFLSLAVDHKPMIALAIGMQAFMGLRTGEACNASYYNIKATYMFDTLKGFSVNLKQKPILRGDGVNVGNIKTPGIAYVHPAFITYFELLYEHHRTYIKDVFKKENKYGAIFMNRDGAALTHESYESQFNELVELLIDRLNSTGNAMAIEEAKMMLEYKFTTHTLRYFFTNFVAMLPSTNIFELANLRRDRSLKSAFDYIRKNPYMFDNKFKALQNNAMKNIGLYKG